MTRTERQADPSVVCGHCVLRDLCREPAAEGWPGTRRVAEPPRRQRVARGEALYRSGDRFEALYAVHTGFFKSRSDAAPAGHVAGFAMSGELLGIDGLGTGQHGCDAVALEDASVCVVPYAPLAAAMRESEPMQRAFHAVIGDEFAAQRRAAASLAGRQAEARLAAFLLGLSQRLSQRGFSAQRLQLRMSRLEIAAHLGLTIETVSRCFGKLQSAGVLAVRSKTVDILDAEALAEVAGRGAEG